MDKHSTRPGSTTMRIGELKIRTSGVPMSGCVDFGSVVANDFEVMVAFTFKPGYAAKADGPAEDCYEAEPAEIEVQSIKAYAAVHFDGDGISLTAERAHDLLPLFTSREIGEIEDRLMAGKRAEEI